MDEAVYAEFNANEVDVDGSWWQRASFNLALSHFTQIERILRILDLFDQHPIHIALVFSVPSICQYLLLSCNNSGSGTVVFFCY